MLIISRRLATLLFGTPALTDITVECSKCSPNYRWDNNLTELLASSFHTASKYLRPTSSSLLNSLLFFFFSSSSLCFCCRSNCIFFHVYLLWKNPWLDFWIIHFKERFTWLFSQCTNVQFSYAFFSCFKGRETVQGYWGGNYLGDEATRLATLCQSSPSYGPLTLPVGIQTVLD